MESYLNFLNSKIGLGSFFIYESNERLLYACNCSVKRIKNNKPIIIKFNPFNGLYFYYYNTINRRDKILEEYEMRVTQFLGDDELFESICNY